ncbi:MAG: hypothetical protein UW39_C0007G0054 [Parcubacteria group bacterium GW2011_GWC2_44_17]|nr:MAG: hypothetical protein UW39_C0007G0054 [Parcubacteria group bacterium GW2011_GWC2_44_17]KKT49487.1 MAG: hypothetical protein UW40_C0020G0015 [Parcubacteria group bacterium GW2011_GWF2_44_17]
MKKDFLLSLIYLSVLVLILVGLKTSDEKTHTVTALAHTIYTGLVR